MGESDFVGGQEGMEEGMQGQKEVGIRAKLLCTFGPANVRSNLDVNRGNRMPQ